MPVVTRKSDNDSISCDRIVDTGDGFLRVEHVQGTGTTRIIPKSDVKNISGKVEDAKPSK